MFRMGPAESRWRDNGRSSLDAFQSTDAPKRTRRLGEATANGGGLMLLLLAESLELFVRDACPEVPSGWFDGNAGEAGG